ncbi:hypothetical protein GDO81_021463 [Engystomops pustulosus]|uniref:Uncharacterized protein n=1 Tax=Engystomops pustulosus TaxID=76066 RepID=A0AAV6YYI1_ENGPU|nr:hypothetical protein GDO81_021463 [Engystomops pustulosus]
MFTSLLVTQAKMSKHVEPRLLHIQFVVLVDDFISGKLSVIYLQGSGNTIDLFPSVNSCPLIIEHIRKHQGGNPKVLRKSTLLCLLCQEAKHIIRFDAMGKLGLNDRKNLNVF